MVAVFTAVLRKEEVEVRVGVRKMYLLTRTRLRGRHERGGERSRERAKEAGPLRREEGCYTG